MFWINCFWVNQVFATVSYATFETAPEEVEVSGIFRPDGGRQINGTYNVLIDFFSEDESVATVSYTEDIVISNNFFRFNLQVLEALETMLYQVESLYVSIYLDEDINAVLPIATTPYSVKSSYGEEGAYSYDEDVFAVDYDNYRIGVGTANPQETLAISGTVNVSEFYFC